MTDHHTLAVQVAQGIDTQSLLDDIAWREVLRPAIDRARQQYVAMLVNATLGVPINMYGPGGAVTPLTREQLAGRISGIDWLVGLFEGILERGDRAALALKELGAELREVPE